MLLLLMKNTSQTKGRQVPYISTEISIGIKWTSGTFVHNRLSSWPVFHLLRKESLTTIGAKQWRRKINRQDTAQEPEKQTPSSVDTCDFVVSSITRKKYKSEPAIRSRSSVSHVLLVAVLCSDSVGAGCYEHCEKHCRRGSCWSVCEQSLPTHLHLPAEWMHQGKTWVARITRAQLLRVRFTAEAIDFQQRPVRELSPSVHASTLNALSAISVSMERISATRPSRRNRTNWILYQISIYVFIK